MTLCWLKHSFGSPRIFEDIFADIYCVGINYYEVLFCENCSALKVKYLFQRPYISEEWDALLILKNKRKTGFLLSSNEDRFSFYGDPLERELERIDTSLKTNPNPKIEKLK